MLGQAMSREHEARLGMAGPVRSGAVEQIHKLPACACGRERAVDGKRAHGARQGHLGRKPINQECDKRILLAALELEPRRHGVAAAFDEQPLMHRAPHGGAEVDGGDGTGRAGGKALRLER